MIKKIKLIVENVESKEIIKVFCNETIKFQVLDDNSINAKDIYESLEYEIDNSYELESLNETIKDNFPKLFKPLNELYNLYNQIILEINNIEIK